MTTHKSCDEQAGRLVACSRQLCFLYTMSCKDEFDEKLTHRVRSFTVIYDLRKNYFKDKIAKDNSWKSIATALERDGKFSV